MNLSESVFKRKKIVYFLLLAIVIGGIFSYKHLSKLEDPEIQVLAANVVTVYPGASAHEVELKVTKVLEDELSTLSDIRKITSRSEANVSVIKVILKFNVPQKEVQQRWEFLRRKVELAVPKLPQGAQKPVIIDDLNDVYGMFYAMTADSGFSYRNMTDYAEYIKHNLLDVKGVKRVSIYGEQNPEINITVSSDKMSKLGIFPVQILSAINSQTKQTYSGDYESGDQEMRVKVSDISTSVEDIKNIVLTAVTGESFKLGDIAAITEDYQTPMRKTLFVDNQKALAIGISMEHGENILDVGKRVEARMAELRGRIPAGINFKKVFFQPEKVNIAIKGFMWNLLESVLIVIVVLMFTMGFRGGLIIGTGLILTILATLPALDALGGTLQRISLGAFIVAMGMLVDNAIVVLDGILLERQKGNRGKSAYTLPAKKAAIPLLGATIIAIVAFLPTFLSKDVAGTYVHDLFLVLSISLSLSWILALTQVPLFSAILLRKEPKRKRKAKSGQDNFDKPVYRFVKNALCLGMRHRGLTVSMFLLLLVIAGLSFKKVDKTFFPDFNYNQFYIELSFPKGTTPDKVNETMKTITKHFESYNEVKMVVSSQGMTPLRYCLVRGMMTESADNYGELIVNFDDYKTMVKMKPVFNKYLRGTFPEIISRIRKYNLSVASTHSIEAQFSGPDPAVLKDLYHKTEKVMLANPHIDTYTLCSDWEPKAKTLTAVYDPAASNRVSVNRSDISNSILAATEGLPVATIYDGDIKLPVRLKVRDNNGNKIENLNDVPVWSSVPNLRGSVDKNTLTDLATGATSADDIVGKMLTPVPLSLVTNGVHLSWEEPVVRRVNGKRTIQVQCDPKDGYSPEQVQAELDKAVRGIKLPEGYEFKWVGASELKGEALSGILSYTPLAFGIIILILLLLFNDYRRPLIILLCLPLSIIGIVPGLLITGQPFSFIAIVGIIGLTGMIIKNAIVLLDEIQTQLKLHETRFDAVLSATVLRVRPVIMASLTTILGMLPLVTDPMYGSMAVAIIGGLIVGTLVTLVFVPILYSIFYGIRIH
ncbi:MAG: efflux RND transporter permease subunit [Bacteroidales bacterium]|jgi:multidrug efflux pump subunit AcrB|nr:efflux RND transporter permease subunit [Bacteroidales bacterium]MCI1785177.1 efflux RND transporter permease subunit [Bacteroidales bacterium]